MQYRDYSKRDLASEGSVVWAAILLSVICSVAILTAWRVASRSPSASNLGQVPSSATPIKLGKNGWSEYRSTELGFAFSYPAEWGQVKLVGEISGSASLTESCKLAGLSYSFAEKPTVQWVVNARKCFMGGKGGFDPTRISEFEIGKDSVVMLKYVDISGSQSYPADDPRLLLNDRAVAFSSFEGYNYEGSVPTPKSAAIVMFSADHSFRSISFAADKGDRSLLEEVVATMQEL